MLQKVLVANRGEIAVRIFRTCAELGIATVAVFSDPDAGALHVRLADEAIALPGSSADKTYLDAGLIVAAALSAGADAVHPGYGFLSEDADFADRVGAAGLTYVGPPSGVVAALGDKVSARALAVAAGVPVLPAVATGIAGDLLDAPAVTELGGQYGWPVLVKAAHGGGGRGMRRVAGPSEVAAALAGAGSEAQAAFGDGTVYAERFLTAPRHIEVQLLADSHGRVAALGDRDCSVQRRHQKLVEEAPAPGLDHDLRTALADAAVRLARSAGYRGAGTVEFLVQDGQFHFLEMNTRIQVEHPVTEAVLGIDLVREQLLIAGGAALTPPDGQPRGHAIECRIVAEDPTRDFLPVPGRLDVLRVPLLPGVRLDSGYEAGDVVPPDYDGLVAKLVVWGPDRDSALRRARAALAGITVAGIPTTLSAAAAVLAHPDFAAGGVSTGWFADVIAPELSVDAAASDEGGAWINGRFHRIPAAPTVSSDRVSRRSLQPAVTRRPGTAAGDGRLVTSPMQGTVLTVETEVGEEVAPGRVVARIEAMKMENAVQATVAGVVEAIRVQPGQSVAAGDVLLVVAPGEPTSEGSR